MVNSVEDVVSGDVSTPTLVDYDVLVESWTTPLGTLADALRALAAGAPDPRRADRYLAAALPYAPSHPPIYLNAAYVHLRLGDVDAALDALREAGARDCRVPAAIRDEPLFAAIVDDPRLRHLVADPVVPAARSLRKPVHKYRQADGQLVALDGAAALRQFIADEDRSVGTERQGCFWPYHSYLLKPLIAKAPQWLDPVERRRLYFHLFRVAWHSARLDAVEYEVARTAYDDLLPLLDRGPATAAVTLQLALLFGYDGRGPLPGAFVEDEANYLLWCKVWRQCGTYTAIPNMLTKVDRFRQFAGDPQVVARALATLRHLRYEHGFGYFIELRFWGLMLIVLLAGGAERDQLLDDVSQLPDRDRDAELDGRGTTTAFHGILNRYVLATKP